METRQTAIGYQPNWMMATTSAGMSAIMTSIMMRLVSAPVLTCG